MPRGCSRSRRAVLATQTTIGPKQVQDPRPPSTHLGQPQSSLLEKPFVPFDIPWKALLGRILPLEAEQFLGLGHRERAPCTRASLCPMKPASPVMRTFWPATALFM